jgi:hypothetical protein
MQRPVFCEPTTVRLQPVVLDQVKNIASREGNTPTAVLRRAISIGLESMTEAKTTAAGSPADKVPA